MNESDPEKEKKTFLRKNIFLKCQKHLGTRQSVHGIQAQGPEKQHYTTSHSIISFQLLYFL